MYFSFCSEFVGELALDILVVTGEAVFLAKLRGDWYCHQNYLTSKFSPKLSHLHENYLTSKLTHQNYLTLAKIISPQNYLT